jgi:protein-S-isoprenylcysteine O-methyltransferase Ste14
MQTFTRLGGWWVTAQFALFGLIAVALFSTGEGWGAGAMVAGWAVAGLGVVLGGAGLVTLGENLSPFPAPRDEATLVARGVYCLVRHPIYGGILLGSMGVGIADGNPAVLGLTVALAVLFWFKSAHEEKRLMARFPDYGDYRKAVRLRLLPWVL